LSGRLFEGYLKRSGEYYYKQITTILFIGLLVGRCTSTNAVSNSRPPGESNRLIAHYIGVKRSEGSILVFVHDNADDYHSDANTTEDDFTTFRFMKGMHTPQVTTVVFEDIPAGRYVISGYHDKDADGRLDGMILHFFRHAERTLWNLKQCFGDSIQGAVHGCFDRSVTA